MIPETIGRYQVQCLLGEGAFGQVFAAWDPVLGRSVAVKMLRPMYGSDAAFMDRFRSEATSVAAMAHPNITLVYDLLQSGAQHGMVMELVRGHTLEHVLQVKTRLGWEPALAITAQAVAGLTNVHRHGVVHRDIKPSNLMLTTAGVLKIMDFGIARVEGTARLTREGNVLGTLAYASPEQIRSGAGDTRSDQYSLACVVYEMLSGRPPFDATTEYELMQAQIERPPEPVSTLVPSVPPPIDQALLQALSKDPQQRFESVEAFGRALGSDTLALKAEEIVKALIADCDPIPPIPEPTRALRPSGAADLAVDKQATPAIAARASANKPLLAIIGAGLAVVGVGGFILIDSVTTPDGPKTAPPIEAKAAVPSEPTRSAAAAPAPPAPPTGETSGARTTRPQPPEPAGPKIAERPSLPQLAIPPEQSPKTMLATPEPPKPTGQPEARQAMAPPRVPPETPRYEGRVVSWFAGSGVSVRMPTGNAIQPLTLYGVRDKGRTQRERDDIRDQLENFLAKYGRDAKCYTRSSSNQTRHLCRIKDIDIGLWAIENGLADPTPDAPAEYQQARR